jgi:hypothetical protein
MLGTATVTCFTLTKRCSLLSIKRIVLEPYGRQTLQIDVQQKIRSRHAEFSVNKKTAHRERKKP